MTDAEKDKLIGELTRLAAEMVRGYGMPSTTMETYELPTATPKHVRRSIHQAAAAAQNKVLSWGHALIDLRDKLKDDE